jgi:hypothetical protein
LNIRDDRTVREQIKSGFRLAGFVLLTFAVFALLVFGTTLLLDKPSRFSGHGLSGRVVGGCMLASLSAFLFFTARYWAKWFVAFVVWAVLRIGLLGILGTTSVRGSRPVSRLWTVEVALILAVLAGLALKPVFSDEGITRVESAGLVCSVLSLVFLLTNESIAPLLVGTSVLGIIRLVEWGRKEHHKTQRLDHSGQEFGQPTR